jgi:hypothetical protein
MLALRHLGKGVRPITLEALPPDHNARLRLTAIIHAF